MIAAVSEWERASWIATTIGLPFAALGVALAAIQLGRQARASRRNALAALYAHLDTHEARLAREFVYRAPAEHLRLLRLHSEGAEEERRQVEDTLAVLERVAYPIAMEQLPKEDVEDTFNLYGRVLLQMSHKLWPYIEDRRTSAEYTDPGFRRYLEAVIRLWAPKYAAQINGPMPSGASGTSEMLDTLFQDSDLSN